MSADGPNFGCEKRIRQRLNGDGDARRRGKDVKFGRRQLRDPYSQPVATVVVAPQEPFVA